MNGLDPDLEKKKMNSWWASRVWKDRHWHLPSSLLNFLFINQKESVDLISGTCGMKNHTFFGNTKKENTVVMDWILNAMEETLLVSFQDVPNIFCIVRNLTLMKIKKKHHSAICSHVDKKVYPMFIEA